MPGLLAAAVVLLGCSEAEDRVREGVGAAVGDAAAVASAQALATAANQVADRDPSGLTVRSVAALRRAAEQLPSAVQVGGIDDGDGDGLDDDARVEVRVVDGAACLVLPTDGGSSDVTRGPC